MNSKQRAFLRGMAMTMNPIVTIGKNGLTENVIAEINETLEARELIKISVLKNCDFTAKQILEELARLTKSTAVQAVGNKITLYRVSKKDDINHIVLP